MKTYLVSILLGCVVGLFCLGFRWGIEELQTLRNGFWLNGWPAFLKIPLYIALIYPVLLFVSRMMERYPVLAGNGAEQTKGILNGHLPRKHAFRFLIRKFVGAIVSLGSGMALGREGPSIQFGGYWGIILSRICRIKPGRQEFLISAGASAGVAAALDAALGGPIYIIESLQKLNNYRIAICSLLSGLTAGLLAGLLMPVNHYEAIRLLRPVVTDGCLLGIFVGMGFFLAVIGLLFTVSVWGLRFLFNRYPGHKSFRLFLFAIWLALIGHFMPLLLGSGQGFMISQALDGTLLMNEALVYAVTYFLFAVFSQAFTFPGGAFLPLLTLGGLCGRLFGLILMAYGVCGPESLSYFMFLGMCGSFIVVMRTPLTGILLVTEMTSHYEILLPAMAVGVIGYFMISVVRITSFPTDLYQQLLHNVNARFRKDLNVWMEVMPYSYFEGKTPQTVDLPYGCTIAGVLRNEKMITFDAGETLNAGDQVYFAIQSTEADRIYQALLSMSSDQE